MTRSPLWPGLVFALLAAGCPAPDKREDLPAIPWTPPPAADGATPRLVPQIGHATALSSVAFSPDETLLVTSASTGPPIVWEVATGRELLRLEGHGRPARAVAFTPDGARIATGGEDRALRFWDPASGEALPSPPVLHPELALGEGKWSGEGAVTALRFSADGTRVLARCRARAAVLLDAATGAELGRYLEAGSETADAAFHPAGDLLLFDVRDLPASGEPGTKERRAFVKRLEHDEVLWSRPQESHARGWFTPDGASVLLFTVGAQGSSLARVDALSGEPKWSLALAENTYLDRCPAVSHAKNQLFLVQEGRVLDLDTGAELFPFADVRAAGPLPLSAEDIVDQALGALLPGDAAAAEPGPPRLAFDYAHATYAPSGDRLAIVRELDRRVHLVDVPERRELQRFAGNTDAVTSVAFSDDGASVLVTMGSQLAIADDEDDHGALNAAVLWDTATGAQVRRFPLVSLEWSAAFLPDGERVITAGYPQPRIWNVLSGESTALPTALDGREVLGDQVAVAPDGGTILVGGDEGTLLFGADGRPFAFHGEAMTDWGHRVEDAAFAPDGSRVVVVGNLGFSGQAGSGHAGHVVRTDTWEVEHTLDLSQCRGVAFAPPLARAGAPPLQRFATVSGSTIHLWDLDAEPGPDPLQPRSTIHAGEREVRSIAFAPDGRTLAAAGADGIARLWNVESGDALHVLAGHEGAVNGVAFSPDGTRLLTGSEDQTTRVWDVATGRELGRVLSFRDGSWAVVDAFGRFDASSGGDVEGLHWVVGRETFALEQLKERYFEPGLLAKLLGESEEELRQVESLFARRLALPPAVAVLAEPDAQDATFTFRVTDRGGGIGRVAVLVNGKEVTSDARPRTLAGRDPNAGSLEVALDLERYPAYVPGADNQLEVLPFNAEQYLSARGSKIRINPAGKVAEGDPRLWAVVAGVSRYRGEDLRLKFAARDAEVMGSALRAAAEGLFGKEGASNVHVTTLVDEQATKAGLTAALDGLKEARWFDVVVVYLAGHGITWDGPAADDDGYYYLTQEALGANITDPDVRARATLSSRELREHLSGLACRKQAVILDTCHAGQLILDLTAGRSVPASQRLALERLKDKTGTFLLAGASADALSYEASPYGHGLLTYSLLHALKENVAPAVREDGTVFVSQLFDHAQNQVPLLAREIGGTQRPQLAMPKVGVSFELGKLDAAGRAKIELAKPLPVVLRSSFQLRDEPLDRLELTTKVNTELRERMLGVRGSGFLFADAAPSAGAYRLNGRYRVEGSAVIVDAVLYRGFERVGAFQRTGQKGDLQALASQLVDEVDQLLAAQ